MGERGSPSRDRQGVGRAASTWRANFCSGRLNAPARNGVLLACRIVAPPPSERVGHPSSRRSLLLQTPRGSEYVRILGSHNVQSRDPASRATRAARRRPPKFILLRCVCALLLAAVVADAGLLAASYFRPFAILKWRFYSTVVDGYFRFDLWPVRADGSVFAWYLDFDPAHIKYLNYVLANDSGSFAVPLWLPLLAGAPLCWILIARSRSLRRRARLGACVSCGYLLTGNTSGVCPECGTRVCRDAAAP